MMVPDNVVLGPLGWLLLMGCGLLIGLSKTGLPGVGILVVAVMAALLPPKASTGLLLPLLIVADVLAVGIYRRHAVWPRLWPLLPWAVGGVVVGCLTLDHLRDAQLGRVIGGIVLVMLIVNRLRERLPAGEGRPPGRWLAPVLGFIAGIMTMLANAAGPVMIIYLLAMRLPKVAFVGTAAWFFLIINCVKVPFSAGLGLITWDSLRFNLMLLPMVMLGALLGVWVLRRLPQRVFTVLVELLAAVAAVVLVWR